MNKKILLTTRQICIFAMLGALMFASKKVMEFLPNIHLIGTLTVTYTVVYRAKALIPLYIYIFLDGLIGGFSVWWIPYLYIWAILWLAVMLLPKSMPKKVKTAVYPTVCALHGFLFGTLYAPFQAIMMHLTLKQTFSWIAAGFTFDAIHGLGNAVLGMLIVPLVKLLFLLERRADIK